MDSEEGKNLHVNYGDQLILDDATKPSKIAIMHAGKLVELLSLLPSDIPQIGSVHIARIQQIFKQHKLANAKLEDDTKISLRISSEQLLTGSLVPVTITAEPWDNKPARAVLGAQLTGRYVILLPRKPHIRRVSKKSVKSKRGTLTLAHLIDAVLPESFGIILRRQALDAPACAIKQEIEILLGDWQDCSASHSNIDCCSTPKKIYSGLSLLQASKIIAPLAKARIFKDDNEWQGVYDQLDYANKPYFITEQKVGIWFQTTKGLTAIDIDSAGSKQSPSKLMIHIAETVLAQIRLRQLSGALFLDMPRLSKADKIKFYKLCHSYALSDIRHPDIYGFGPAGLLEMTVPRRYMTLENRMKLMFSNV